MLQFILCRASGPFSAVS